MLSRQELSEQTGIPAKVVNTWFINARKRRKSHEKGTIHPRDGRVHSKSKEEVTAPPSQEASLSSGTLLPAQRGAVGEVGKSGELPEVKVIGVGGVQGGRAGASVLSPPVGD